MRQRDPKPLRIRTAEKFLFDDRAIIGGFDASVRDPGEVISFFPLPIDSFLSPSQGSADSKHAGVDRDLR